LKRYPGKLIFHWWWFPPYILLCLLIVLTVSVHAQDNTSAPQFLYRNGEQLFLVDASTGAETLLPDINASEIAYHIWSPNGRYLLTSTRTGDQCLNVYDVDALAWVNATPFACQAYSYSFSHDSSQIAYTIYHEDDGVLEIYDIGDNAIRRINTDTPFRDVFGNIGWSSTDEYLSFNQSTDGADGSITQFKVFSLAQNAVTVTEEYNSSSPIWSPDGQWFLLRQKPEEGQFLPVYTSDLFLYRAADGEHFRVTNTPFVFEEVFGWTEDGEIYYTIEVEQRIAVEEAMTQVLPVMDQAEIESHVSPLDYYRAVYDSDYGEPLTYVSPEHDYIVILEYIQDSPQEEMILVIWLERVNTQERVFSSQPFVPADFAFWDWRPAPGNAGTE
jgi:hypothetical protein